MQQELKQLVTSPVKNRKSKCMCACSQLALSTLKQFSLLETELEGGWVFPLQLV